ncbi:cysteine peptidase family C39 domain-containing protein [Tepidimonas charontis]|uniref:Peptidase C39 family protein n=1 Tax=Tepidimonas charontis TaxID=2267262 RepID=A0A554X168_9BURK|nr:cysteine peptidase family C39 domain-containing protein [Tepidimonas charontis]TSE29589.1 Peptidase C39 family protein [Tepidimonas charontis]
MAQSRVGVGDFPVCPTQSRWPHPRHLLGFVRAPVKSRKNDHFSVLRGIDGETVWLADPSLGNRTYSRSQFLEMWRTRTDQADALAGKFLAVLPARADIVPNGDFFTKAPRRQSAGAVVQLAHRPWP